MEFAGGVLTGVIVALITQLVTAVHVKPVLDVREVIGEIATSLIYYANVYGPLMKQERKREAQASLREHASRLRAKAHVPILAGVWYGFGLIPKRVDLVQASRHLIALSNYVFDSSPDAGMQATRLEEKIKKLLNIEDKSRQEASSSQAQKGGRDGTTR